MKKIFLLIQFAALTAGVNAFAIAGGPFDNGSYSTLMERNGFYQTSFSLKNGSGYSIFTADNQVGTLIEGNTLTPNVGSGSLMTQSNLTGLVDHNANRSVLYYKGVTYLGSAMGEVDFEGRKIHGTSNLSSEVVGVQQSSQVQGLFIGQTSNTVTDSGSVVANGRSYVANVDWSADITDTAPQVRWTGEGELVIMSPNGRETIAGLAYNGYSGLISSINTAVSSQGSTAIFGIDVGLFADAQTAINNALGALSPFLTGTGPQNSLDEAESAKITVTGYLRYF